MTIRKTLFGLALLLPSLLAHADPQAANPLQIEGVWSREMPPVTQNAAVYFVVRNGGTEDDRLLGASTPVAEKAELHEHQHAGGVMKMQQVQSVAIPAGGSAEFAPMGYHVMLFGVAKQAKEGERFPLRLRFEKAGETEVEVTVRREAPMPASHGAHHH